MSSGSPMAVSWLPATRLAMRLTGAGEHRHPHEQRIVGGGAGVVGRGVEEQIGVDVTGQMLGQAHPRREHQPLRRSIPRAAASRRRLARAVALPGASQSTLPGTAPSSRIQTVEHRRQNLVACC